MRRDAKNAFWGKKCVAMHNMRWKTYFASGMRKRCKICIPTQFLQRRHFFGCKKCVQTLLSNTSFASKKMLPLQKLRKNANFASLSPAWRKICLPTHIMLRDAFFASKRIFCVATHKQMGWFLVYLHGVSANNCMLVQINARLAIFPCKSLQSENFFYIACDFMLFFTPKNAALWSFCNFYAFSVHFCYAGKLLNMHLFALTCNYLHWRAIICTWCKNCKMQMNTLMQGKIAKRAFICTKVQLFARSAKNCKLQINTLAT